MTARVFVDTNILVFAFADAGDDHHGIARSIVEELIRTQRAELSVQVLSEFYFVATRKIKRPLPRRDAVTLVKDLSLACNMIDNALPQLERGLSLRMLTLCRSGMLRSLGLRKRRVALNS